MPEKIILEKLYISGLAYLTINGKGHIREKGKGIKEASGIDYSPMVTQFQILSPFSEPGRKFHSRSEAELYMQALTLLDKMVHSAIASGEEELREETRTQMREICIDMQGQLNSTYLPMLRTVSRFDTISEYLNQTPEEIRSKLESMSKDP